MRLSRLVRLVCEFVPTLFYHMILFSPSAFRRRRFPPPDPLLHARCADGFSAAAHDGDATDKSITRNSSGESNSRGGGNPRDGGGTCTNIPS